MIKILTKARVIEIYWKSYNITKLQNFSVRESSIQLTQLSAKNTSAEAPTKCQLPDLQIDQSSTQSRAPTASDNKNFYIEYHVSLRLNFVLAL